MVERMVDDDVVADARMHGKRHAVAIGRGGDGVILVRMLDAERAGGKLVRFDRREQVGLGGRQRMARPGGDLVAQPCGGGQHELVLGDQAADGLAYAHARGFVHRDVKPSNVFLSDRGGVPDYVKVLDFGLIHDCRTDNDETDKDGLAGTPWFMAPEMIQNPATADARSDIYAMGGLAYFLLTGKYMFDSESVSVVLEKQLNEIPAPPSAITENPISPLMEQIILACLEKDPAGRPQSALELAARLAESPAANDSTPDSRAAWWLMFRNQKVDIGSPA